MGGVKAALFALEDKIMKVVSSEAIYEESGNKYLRVSIYADTVPSPMPEPEDIPGYDNTFDFMPGSTLYEITTGKVYMAGEDGNWHEQ